MKILVTGGAGFIGQHLCRRLLREGHEVVCLDNFATSDPCIVDELFYEERRMLCVHLDVRHLADVWRDRIGRCNQIYHLACPASPVYYQRQPVFTIDTAYLGTKCALDTALAWNARLVIASTSEVYGDPEVVPQPESYVGAVNPTGPRSCYDEGKRAAEALAFAMLASKYYPDFRIARIFNTYGPRMRSGDGRIIPNFITQGLAGEPITVHGDGSQTRSFCYVDDTVDGLIRLMDASLFDPTVRVVNIGNPDERTVGDVAYLVRSKTGSRSVVSYFPLPADDPKRRCPDIARAKSLLGWEPKVDFNEGLDRTVEWFRAKRATDHPKSDTKS